MEGGGIARDFHVILAPKPGVARQHEVLVVRDITGFCRRTLYA
jgi:hypothetical protein